MPYLMPENQIPYLVYNKVSDQHIIGPTGSVGLRLEPVFKVMELMGIDKEDQLFCMELVQRAHHAIIEGYKDKKV